jgi:hypothetical protein
MDTKHHLHNNILLEFLSKFIITLLLKFTGLEVFNYGPIIAGVMRWCSWLGHCVPNQKVADLIPDEEIEIFN